MKWKSLLFFALNIFATACSPRRTSDLTVVGGKEDRSSYPATVALSNDLGQICTAAFISDRFLLTAAHCITAAVKQVQVTSELEPFRSYPPLSGVFHRHPNARIAANGIILFTDVHADVGIVEFPAGTAGGSMIARLASAAPQANDPVVLVGYGKDRRDAAARIGTRNIGRNKVQSIENTLSDIIKLSGVYETPAVVDENTAALTSGGDSGGPVYNSRGEVIGVTSIEVVDNAAKTASTYYANVTAPATRQFIDSVIRSAGSAAPGTYPLCSSNGGMGYGDKFTCDNATCAKQNADFSQICRVQSANNGGAIEACKSQSGRGYGDIFACGDSSCAKENADFSQICRVQTSTAGAAFDLCKSQSGRGYGDIFACGDASCAKENADFSQICRVQTSNTGAAFETCKSQSGRGYGDVFTCGDKTCAKQNADYTGICVVQ